MKKLLLALIAVLTLLSCKDSGSENDLKLATDKVEFTKEGELTITKADSTTIDLDIEIADNDYETQTGLMYRNHMDEDQGMLFVFDDSQVHTFYMKNTEIPLDILYITADKKIATIVKNAAPLDESSLSSQIPVQYVLEVNAGMVDKWELAKGDEVDWAKE